MQNNILHAKGLLDLLSEYPPESYFCVSTDKAANPVNIMGASKRIMEDLIFCYSDRYPVKTARFANVAFSNGSLPAGFLMRIQKKQPLSAPSDVKRYFVSPEESGQICLLSCILGKNREIMFPKLDEARMMSFDAIGTELLKVYGYQPLYCDSEEEAIRKMDAVREGCREYPVYYSASDTSGEKPYEEFVTASERTDMERFSSLGVITDKDIPDRDFVEQLIDRLNRLFDRMDITKEQVVETLESYLPEFHHVETGKNLDGKM